MESKTTPIEELQAALKVVQEAETVSRIHGRVDLASRLKGAGCKINRAMDFLSKHTPAKGKNKITLLMRLRGICSWHTVFDSGVYLYQENSVTGERIAIQYRGGYQPLARSWLSGGEL